MRRSTLIFLRLTRRANAIVPRLAAAAIALIILGETVAADPARRMVVLGDSLTAGYGLAAEDAFPAKLQAALGAQGFDWEVINAGISGDTSAGGLARLDWVLADRPEIVIVELGANDGLRGLPTEDLFDNLDAILTRLGELGATTLLAGMLAPPNFGEDYTQAFRAVYERLAAKHSVALYPFFLDGVAAVPSLNQSDGLHPNVAGVEEIVRRILPHVVAVIRRHKAG